MKWNLHYNSIKAEHFEQTDVCGRISSPTKSILSLLSCLFNSKPDFVQIQERYNECGIVREIYYNNTFVAFVHSKPHTIINKFLTSIVMALITNVLKRDFNVRLPVQIEYYSILVVIRTNKEFFLNAWLKKQITQLFI